MFESDETLSPLIWVFVAMLWVGFIAFLLVGVLTGNMSWRKVGLMVASVAILQFILSTGLLRLIFFETLDTSILVQLKRITYDFSSSFFYPIVIFGVFFFNETMRYEKAIYLLVLSVLSLFWLTIFYKRTRLIEDTAKTTLNSAAQGYAVVKGKVALYENEVARSPSKEFPVMIWYRKLFRTSSAGFILDDNKGLCTINPRDAEVITPLRHYNGHSFHAIYPGDTVYVIGLLETLSKQRTEYERKTLISAKLLEWKRVHLKFLDYFDSNRDGKIDDQEMRAARNAAERVTDDQLESIYLEPATHIISSPADGRPFILSSIHPDKLIVRYKRAMLFHFSAWVILSLFTLAMHAH